MRKRKISILLLVVLTILLLISATSVYAAITPKVYDKASIFTKSELEKLEGDARKISEELKLDVVIVSIDDNEGKTSRAYADDFYDNNGFGYGEDADGILMLINMEDREVYISTCGIAIKYFTDARIEGILDVVYADLADGNFGDAATSFLDEVDYLVRQGIPVNQTTQSENVNVSPVQENNPGGSATPSESKNAGKPLSSTVKTENPQNNIPAYLIISFIIASIFTMVSVRRHNHTSKTNEVSYLKNGSINLISTQDDQYDTNITQRIIYKETVNHSNQSGRSTVHTSSSGRTHGGGGRSFGSSGGGRNHGGGGRKF
jgi:uncharacterized protein